MLAGRCVEVGCVYHAGTLDFEGGHNFGQGDAWGGFQLPWEASEGGNGLDMQAAHVLALRHGPAKGIAEQTVVHAAHQRAHQHHAKPGIPTGFNGSQLLIKAFPASQGKADLVAHSIELQIDGIQSGLAESAGIILFRAEAQAVAVELNKAEAA